MLALLKNAAKRLPFPALLSLYYGWWWMRDVRRAASNRRKLRLPPLNAVDLTRWKGSDVLFVLGSGPSINAITAERWHAMARHDTLGFNFWLYHPFVPKMYFVESGPFAQTEFVSRTYAAIAARRAPDYTQTLKAVTGLHEPGEHEVAIWSEEWQRGFHAAYDLPVAARTPEELDFALRFLQRRGGFRPSPRMQYVFKYGSSVTTMITLGLRMGYKAIVLCGIDLKAQEYFYQDPELYPESASLELVPRGQPHASTQAVPWRVPAADVIRTLKRLLLDPAGVGLFVENRSSALWPEIPEMPVALLDGGEDAGVPAGAGRGAPSLPAWS